MIFNWSAKVCYDHWNAKKMECFPIHNENKFIAFYTIANIQMPVLNTETINEKPL